MNRKDFIRYLGLFSLTGATMKLKALYDLGQSLDNSEKMPVLFLGHGSPMNAIEENEFVQGFRKIGETIPQPKAILCISAHWETRGTWVTSMANPRTIHDFGGFPQELFEVQYPAPGDPELAKEVSALVKTTNVGLDQNWGLDHGAWSVIKHLYPNANIPVIQFSLDRTQSPAYHYELAAQLASLRNKGVLIIGSGNMVHNLGRLAWNRIDEVGYAYDWAAEADQTMKALIDKGDHRSLIEYNKLGAAFQLAIPTPEHYLPLIYTLGLKGEKEEHKYFNDKALAGSLTMTSLKIG